MPLKIQIAVLDLVSQVLGGSFTRVTPGWLNRPGRAECGTRWPLICTIYRDLTGLELPDVMPANNRRTVDGVLDVPSCPPRIVEVDETQHFNRYRGLTFGHYPDALPLAFDRQTWAARSQGEPRQKSGGWAAPKPPLFPGAGGRHRQRAFRDALADILPPDHGFLPTLRIADLEVESWIGSTAALSKMKALLTSKLGDERASLSEDL